MLTSITTTTDYQVQKDENNTEFLVGQQRLPKRWLWLAKSHLSLCKLDIELQSTPKVLRRCDIGYG